MQRESPWKRGEWLPAPADYKTKEGRGDQNVKKGSAHVRM